MRYRSSAAIIGRVARDNEAPPGEPSDELSFVVLGRDAGFRERLEAALIDRGIPAVLMEDAQRGEFRPVVVRLLTDEEQPLRWVTFEPGTHGWERVDAVGLFEELSEEPRSVVASSVGLFGADEDSAADEDSTGESYAAEIAAVDAAFTVDSFTWYAPGDGDIHFLSALAQRAGQPLVGSPAGRGYVARPTGDADPVYESMVWAMKGGLFLARSGERRGAGFSSKRGPIIHWWDETWITVDPSRPWDTDSDGRHVRDWLDLLVPEADTESWTTGFRLDGPDAEALRIILRSPLSDDSTFDRLVRAVRAPSLLADVATGRVILANHEDAATFEPDSLWGSMKQAMRDEVRRPVAYPAWARPLETWQKHRQRRSALYLAVNGAALAVFVVSVIVTAATGVDNGLQWLKIVAFTVIVADVFWPRRDTREEIPESDAS